VKLVVRALHFAIGILAIFLGKYARIAPTAMPCVICFTSAARG